ncbi:hypothetical protein PPL_08563 [Heterostelium album PN500]|uniref:FNIP repeat-containing protein n=1 Tax=Heterostelium pallidum (strain ATCC 26659 / Pp 5 / PN500) TaxID=670386 RepID=D3BJ41_HETP5|nr:hypothetical protein PPL_08563 [Heterostelium album PN500]EFA77921.1 hypothetical protein PPL_08563 [Heterostelium album PN500]|eukprot:XP_020430049.1 hypothetical protein PPL_08563 [Heterostelium album PN500]
MYGNMGQSSEDTVVRCVVEFVDERIGVGRPQVPRQYVIEFLDFLIGKSTDVLVVGELRECIAFDYGHLGTQSDTSCFPTDQVSFNRVDQRIKRMVRALASKDCLEALSHILLAKIVDFLDDNIDKICFTLACKRWFNERDKYLTFNFKQLHLFDSDSDYIHLNSYRSSIIRSINKRKYSLIISDHKYSNHDYIISPKKLQDIDTIESNIYLVKIPYYVENTSLERFYEIIAKSNVMKLKGWKTTSHKLPQSLTSLRFTKAFDEPLEPGYLPPNLKSIRFYYFGRPIQSGVFPLSLRKLVFGNSFNQPLGPGILPASLEILKFKGTLFTQGFQLGSLPPNLKTLVYSGHDIEIDEGVLPDSIYTLRYVPPLWISSIRSLSNLRSLTFYLPDDSSNHQISLSDLPTSLTALYTNSSVELKSTLHPSIKYLDISYSKYDVDEIFKYRSTYQFELLSVDGSKLESLENLKIKRLAMPCSSKKYQMREIPHGIKELELGQSYSSFLDSLPTSVKKLTVSHISQIDSNIVDSINELVVKNIRQNYTAIPFRFKEALETLAIPTMVIPYPNPKNTFFNISGKTICLRRINDNQFIIFGQTSKIFVAAFVDGSQLENIRNIIV